MRQLVVLIPVLGLLVGVGSLHALAKDLPTSVKSLPPVVIQTVPVSGDTRVDASKTHEIRVTFSKKMRIDSWSWVQVSKETFPTIAGNVHFDKEGTTCVAPVKLEHGRTYVVWFNTDRYGSFEDVDGHPAVPYLLVFETKPEK